MIIFDFKSIILKLLIKNHFINVFEKIKAVILDDSTNILFIIVPYL